MRFVKVFALISLTFSLLVSTATAGAFKFRSEPGDMRWINGRVPYVFKPDVTSGEQLVFKRCVRAWQRFGNIRFVPTTEDILHHSPDGDYLLVQRNDLEFLDLVKDVNYAWIGRSSVYGFPYTGMQPMSIHNWTTDIVVHEMGHTLGFIHEQMRTDRDSFVQLNWDQINGFTTINFNIETNSTNVTDYDYDSIMHYASTAFRDTWKTGETMVAIADPSKTDTMGRNRDNPPHPEDLKKGAIGKITALLSDGDRMAIGAEYGKPTEVKGVITLPSGLPLKGVTAVLLANGSAADEDAFIDLVEATGEKTVTSNAAGEFFFRGVPTGSFKIRVSKPGFSFVQNESTFVGASTPLLTHNFSATNTEVTPPSSSISTPADGESYATPPSIIGEASDTGGAGLKEIQLAMDSGSRWWNWTTSSYGAVGADFDEAINAKVHSFFAGNSWSIPSTVFSALPDGTHHLQVRASDFSGNVDQWEGVTFTVDRVSPSVAIDPHPPAALFFDFETLPLGGTVSDATDPEPVVTFTLCENNVSAANRYWTGSTWTTNSLDPNINLPARVAAGRWQPLLMEALPQRAHLQQGGFTVSAKAVDHASHVAGASSITLTRTPTDNTVPDVAIVPSFDGSRYSERALPAFTGTASDVQSYIKGVRLYFMRFVPGLNGAPNSFKYWTGEEWSDTPGHLEVAYNHDDYTWQAPAMGYRLPSGAAELPDGTYKLQATAFNRESPQGTRLIEETFHIALAPPQISITTPAHQGFVKAGWSISGTVTDHSGTGFDNDRVNFTLFRNGQFWDGNEWNATQVVLEAAIKDDGTWTYPGTDPDASLPVGEAEYAISAYVKDRNGNLSVSVAGGQTGNNQITFSVDTTPPECLIASPTSGVVITASPVDSAIFNGTATDSSGQPQMALYLKRLSDNYFWTGSYWNDDQADAALTGIYEGGPASEAWVLKEDFPCLNHYWWGMPNGTYELTALARDAAGNETQKCVTIAVDYRPVWLRPQDELVRVLPGQTAPIDGATITGNLVQTFTPWLDDQPGNGGHLNPISFTADSQGRYFVTNLVAERIYSYPNDKYLYHGVIQRLGPGGWRRQRVASQVVDTEGQTTYYEQWSPDLPVFQISAYEGSIHYAEPRVAKTDAAGNTYVAFNLTHYSQFSESPVQYMVSVMVVKFDADGNLVWRRIVPQVDPGQFPEDWLERSTVHALDVSASGAVSVVLSNVTSYSFNYQTYYYRQKSVVVRISSAGAVQGVTHFGHLEDADNNIPYLSSAPEFSAIDAVGNAYVMTSEALEGNSYASQVLRKISPNGSILATHETNLCKVPQHLGGVATDDQGNVYVLSTFDLGNGDGRACVTKFDGSLTLLWRAFAPPRTVNISNSITDNPNYQMHVGSQGITISQFTPGGAGSGTFYEHPLVSRFSFSGDLLWSRAVMSDNPQGRDGLDKLQVTPIGDVLFTGWFSKGQGVLAQPIYGKISNAGDLQFFAPINEPDSIVATTLLPNNNLAALHYAYGGEYSPNGEERVLVYDNPATMVLPVTLDESWPQDQTVTSGTAVELKVINHGSPATYQWRKENAQGVPQNIANATSTALRLENVQTTDSGKFSCVVTNGQGSATSRTAVLTVLQNVALDVALDDSGRTWTTGGDAPWVGFASTPSHDGVDAARSGAVGYDQNSWIETEVTGPAIVSFWWKISSEDYFDNVTLTVDGETVGISINGDQDWTQASTVLGAGQHTLRWTFKSYIDEPGSNTAFLDALTVSTPVPLAQAIDNTDLTFTSGGAAAWYGVPGSSAHDGVDSGSSGNINDGEESWVETSVTGPGLLSFWWKVSSEFSYDYFKLQIDDQDVGNGISGEVGWTKVTQAIAAGSHTVRWVYSKEEAFSGGQDTAWLDQVTFSAGGSDVAPSFVTQPQSQIGVTGGLVYMYPELADVSDSTTYQWYKGTAQTVIGGAVLPAFGFGNAKTTDANVYRLKVASGDLSATSDPAYIGIATRGPQTVEVKEGGTLTLTAAVTVPASCSISAFHWYRDNENLEDGTTSGVTITGAETKTLKITGMKAGNAGAYTCHMTMTMPDNRTAMGNNGHTHVTVIQKPVITAPLSLANYTVSQSVDIDITASNGPTRFIVSGLPPGVVANATTGKLSGKPTAASKVVNGLKQAYQVKISASNAAGTGSVVIVPWIIEALDTRAVGVYNAIVGRNAGLNGLTDSVTGLGGIVKLTVTGSGSTSGTIKLGSLAPYKLTRALDIPEEGGNPTYHLNIVRMPKLPDLEVDVEIDLATGAVSGEVTDGTNTAEIAGWRATASTAYHGRHHLGLFPDASLALDTAYPQGTGYATLTVSGTGTAAWACKLADNTAVTGSFPLGPDGQVPLYALLYSNTGSIQGWATINSATHHVDGSPGLTWYKPGAPAKSTTRSYKVGIPVHELTVAGGLYVTKSPSLHAVLDLGPPPLNVQAELSLGGLSSPLTQSFSITAPNAVAVPANSLALKLSIASATGIITGGFTQPGLTATTPRKASIYGIVIPRLTKGVGFFLLPEQAEPPVTSPANAPIWSGKLEVQHP